jgi:hypothetical protein
MPGLVYDASGLFSTAIIEISRFGCLPSNKQMGAHDSKGGLHLQRSQLWQEILHGLIVKQRGTTLGIHAG